jgi:hypothetical protein
LWGCREVRKIWQAYNEYLVYIRNSDSKVLSYDDVFVIGHIGIVSKVKMKNIQEIIQIEHPVYWSVEKLFLCFQIIFN